jgi:hypothetical protein
MPGWAGTASSPVNQAAHKRNKKQDKKQVEQKLCDSRRGNRDPAKTERRSYDRDHKKTPAPNAAYFLLEAVVRSRQRGVKRELSIRLGTFLLPGHRSLHTAKTLKFRPY